ncbi:hypothetical protein LN042_11500 [Kitasatospora sp. RB6PN24]|uniref:hypothetical protein n=1 Tax=Kitasatospora humi TaxID=2893891 RepID=UPI001E34362F|nr:hypothetical protein [Kitasatospora humi]MCC9307714.1 hypothetical protein [Kitasatospora humi]
MAVIEQQPQPGDIGLVRIRGTVGRLIRLGQWLNGDGYADYEHAFIVVGPDADGRQQLVEAQPGGARLGLLTEYDDRHVLYVTPTSLAQEQRARIAQAALERLGTPYSFLDYLALAAHRFRLPVPGLRQYIKARRSLICSQLVDQCYQNAGVQLFTDGRWPGYVTPGALYDLLGSASSRQNGRD